MFGFLKRNRTFIAAVITILTVRGTFADQNYIPSGSMEPTIHVGDHILVNKLAYDVHLPYTKTMLARIDDPKRGDIIVFHNPQSDMRMVKRLIGVPGRSHSYPRRLRLGQWRADGGSTRGHSDACPIDG